MFTLSELDLKKNFQTRECIGAADSAEFCK